MSSTAIVPALQVAVPGGTAIAPAIIILLTSGLVGMSIKNMFDSILSDEDDGDAAGGDEMADGGGLMAEDGDGDDDFGDLGGLGGDEGGDELDGFGGDEFGDMDDAAGADTDELEHRLDELENEVGSLSSTVSTVRTENEQISESVDEVQENVRKLLDIYEMVTRGVNPFADDIEAGMGGGMGGESSFGLFDDGDDGGNEEEDIDDGIANADAEGFFDEDLVEDDADAGDSVDDMFGDDGGDDAFEDDGGSFDEEFEDDFDDDGGDGGDGGKSFQELKDEYDSGDAEWADGEAPDDEGGDDFDDGLEGDELFEEDDFEDESDDDGLEGDELFEDDGFEDEEFGDVVDESTADDEPTAPEAEPGAGTDQPSATDQSAETATESETAATADSAATDGGKPYLATLPSGFASDLIVVEWLEFLLQQAGHREAARAIDYYETIDWIDEDVAADLQEVLRGFDDVGGGDGGLTIDHHTRSLQYISQLDDDSGQAVALSKLVGGGADGLQR
ncbi:flagellar protein FlaE [Halomicrobium zhouii]|uniref:Flagellar protein FlaE n=1 Tax=Halomicrobium zhouii TaxID=767519 RepID=A0A1I6L4V6_9EURY|nr:FlaD/FlaE family flagellar protein [Halomicrobium zhouii]SFR98472.1 flagellar protein FlaE [Halomicrobium zhouii]